MIDNITKEVAIATSSSLRAANSVKNSGEALSETVSSVILLITSPAAKGLHLEWNKFDNGRAHHYKICIDYISLSLRIWRVSRN